LRILDSTVPQQIKALENDLVLAKTLFIVSSKSGGTTEPNILTNYFFGKVADRIGSEQAGRQFIAITDPGSSLERRAKDQKFRRTFHGVVTIGGRYSVLSPFGLVPAAIAGLDVTRLVELSRIMMRSCGPDVPPMQNPGVELGIALGLSAARGRDKVTILASPRIAAFGAWAEQLFAESTGKQGRGLIPITGEPIGRPEVYGDDRFFIDLALKNGADADHELKLKALEKAGHPVARVEQNSPAHIVQEFFRFEIATAAAGSVLGINPFDQPDVEASKSKTRELSSAYERSGMLPKETPICSESQLSLYTDEANAAALRKNGADGSVESFLTAHFSRIVSGDYFALFAYLARDERNISLLQQLRLAMRDRRRVATCLEFGPRFLHSTGQAYKGGPDSGVFLQITADNREELAIPRHRATFGVVNAAQARGDFEVLLERGRRALRVHLNGDLDSGLAALKTAFERALT
jgi:transaldolase/glucose-6-phosphate isomerase